MCDRVGCTATHRRRTYIIRFSPSAPGNGERKRVTQLLQKMLICFGCTALLAVGPFVGGGGANCSAPRAAALSNDGPPKVTSRRSPSVSHHVRSAPCALYIERRLFHRYIAFRPPNLTHGPDVDGKTKNAFHS